RSSLATADDRGLARAMFGAVRLAEDLRAKQRSEEAWRRIVSWLGTTARPAGTVQALTDRVLVEIARESLSGRVRAAIERRYLLDLTSTEVFREERAAGQAASVGPCPRRIDVGLGEAEQGAPLRR